MTTTVTDERLSASNDTQGGLDASSAKDPEPGVSLEESSQINTPQTRQRAALDWDGPNDKENPHNWSVGKKLFHSAVPAVYTFAL